MGWRDAARRHLIGEQTPLASVNGELWICPRKWSTVTAEYVGEFRRQMLAKPGAGEKLRRLVELEEKYSVVASGGEIAKETLRDLDSAELIELSNSFSIQDRADMYRKALEDGIGAHNFSDEKGQPIGGGEKLDAATIDEVLTHDVLANEMFQVIEAFNRPLARRSRRSSETSSSGSSAVTDSQKEKSTPTGPVQRS